VNKRAIAILGAIFVLIVGGLGFLIYQRNTSEPETPTAPVITEEPEQPEVPQEPEQPAGRAVKLSDDAVVTPILFYQGNGISYFDSTGRLFQTDLQVTDSNVLLSNKRELTIALKPSISKILWPQAGNNLIAEINAGNKTWSFYDSSKAAYVDLPTQISSVDWLPSGDKIAYVWVENGQATLNISNPDASGYKTLTTFWEADNVIDVSPDGQIIAFHRTQTADPSKNVISTVSIDGKTFKDVVTDGYNQGISWSPDSKKLLFTKRDNSSLKYNLWVADVVTGEVRNLGFATSVEKVVWAKDGRNIYAAVPVSGTAGSGLTEDSFFKMDVTTLQKSEIQPGVAVDGRDLFLSSSENILFFRNAQDNALYYISL
jgi:hypothetical protein